jgi:hypothetical protein
VVAEAGVALGFGVASLLVLAQAGVGGGDVGYLPAVGPAALRFRSPEPPGGVPALPPLSLMESPVSDGVAGATNAAARPVGAGSGAEGGRGTAIAGSGAGVGRGEPVPQPVSVAGRKAEGVDPEWVVTPGGGGTTPLVTPQMLLQYFRPVGSNYVNGAWTVPVFVPPLPGPGTAATPAASSAVYRSP